MDYTSLISDMKTYMLRTDPPYVTKIPDLIQQGIIRVYNNAKDLGFEITLNVDNVQANQSIINKPGNWRETVSIHMIDLQNNSIFLLRSIVSMPIVMAYRGVGILSKNLELATCVRSLKITVRVCEYLSDPGSLKAICPLWPSPRTVRSRPPCCSIIES